MSIFCRYISICLAIVCCAGALFPAAALADEPYGPPNLLKTELTPFTKTTLESAQTNSSVLSLTQASPSPLAIASPARRLAHRSLADRLVQAKVYLPGRMVIGKPATFVIHGKPGWHAALAMADRDSGAKAIYGHDLRLGPDRKVVSIGVIPESGILELTIETPIQGDLIGQNLFFEAALWSAEDYSDLTLATPITSEGQEGVKNGVQVAADFEDKRGVKIVPDTGIPMNQRGTINTLDSGRP
jgi:hypothetical protein